MLCAKTSFISFVQTVDIWKVVIKVVIKVTQRHYMYMFKLHPIIFQHVTSWYLFFLFH